MSCREPVRCAFGAGATRSAHRAGSAWRSEHAPSAVEPWAPPVDAIRPPGHLEAVDAKAPTRDQLIAFARRDWGRVGDADVAHRAKLWRERGPLATARLSWALREHARAVRADYPGADARERDLADHLRLIQKLDAVASLFSDA